MKKLTSTLALTYRHCQSLRMTGEAKQSEGKAEEYVLSVSVIQVDKRKKEEKTFALSSSLGELVVDSKEDKEISGNSERVEKTEVEKIFFSECRISVYDAKKEMTVDKGGEIQISHHTGDVKSIKVAAEKDTSVKGIVLDKEAKLEKYFAEAVLILEEMKTEENLWIS